MCRLHACTENIDGFLNLLFLPFRVNTAPIITHDFPLSQFEEVSQKVSGTSLRYISDWSEYEHMVKPGNEAIAAVASRVLQVQHSCLYFVS